MRNNTPLCTLTLVLTLVLTLLTPLASANFLDKSGWTNGMWFNLDPKTDTIIRVGSLSEAWPLDMPPWDFVEAVVNASCTDRGCFHPTLKAPAHILVQDDSAPVATEVTLAIEGIFDPHRECCTRHNMVRMMGLMLKEMYDPTKTEFLLYESTDPETNQTSKEYVPIYIAPKALSVGVGFRLHEKRNTWLSLRIDGPSRRLRTNDQCHRFLDIRHRLSRTLKTQLGYERRRMGYAECLWPGYTEAPPFPKHYKSPAVRILRKVAEEKMKKTRG